MLEIEPTDHLADSESENSGVPRHDVIDLGDYIDPDSLEYLAIPP